MKGLDTFRGRKIDCQLDSNRKPFRKVYKAGDEVIIIYLSKAIPDSMLRQQDGKKLPLEWLYYDEYRKNGDEYYPEWMNSYGLPRINEMGIDNGNPYIIEEYLKGELMADSMDDVKEDEKWETYIAMGSYLTTCFKNFRLFGNNGQKTMITPRNIFFAGIGEENPGYEGMSMKYFGIDGILFPEYHDPSLLKYYDGRFLYPCEASGAKHYATYSLALSIVSCLDSNIPKKQEDIEQFICSQPFNPHDAVSLCLCLQQPLLQKDTFSSLFETEWVKHNRLASIELKRTSDNNEDNNDYKEYDLCEECYTRRQKEEDGALNFFPKKKLPKS